MSIASNLAKLNIKEFMVAKGNPSVLSCADSDPLSKVMDVIVTNKILSLPVYALDEFVGSVGLVEIIKFITDRHWTYKNDSSQHREAAIYVEFNNSVVSDIMTPKSIKVHETADLKLAIQTLVGSDLHRLPVVNAQGHVVHIITDSDVVQLLLDGLAVTPSDKKVKDLPIIASLLNSLSKTGASTDDLFLSLDELRRQDSKLSDLLWTEGRESAVSRVNAVHQSAKAIEAFRLILGSNVTAVPIVDNDKTILSTLSIRDIRRIAMNFEQLGLLYEENALDFSQRVFEKGLSEDDLTKTKSNIGDLIVDWNDSLETVLTKLKANRIFRVWLADEKNRPVGVVTLKDVLNELLA